MVDAFVSLHRSEGFGFTLIEAMYLGKPVVGTQYSGNLDLVDNNDAAPGRSRTGSNRSREYAYDNDSAFAGQTRISGTRLITCARLVDDEHFRTRIAQRGRRDVSERFSMSRVADLMRERLAELGLL